MAIVVMASESTYSSNPFEDVIASYSTDQTITLPEAQNGISVTISNANTTSSPVTVQTATAGNLIYGPGESGVASISLNTVGGFVALVCDGTNWHIVAGSSDSGWIFPTPISPWAPYSDSSFAPSYRRQGNRVMLRGVAEGGVSGIGIFILPTGFAPTKELLIPMSALDASGYVAAGIQIVQTSGSWYVNPWYSGTSMETIIGLDGVSFPID